MIADKYREVPRVGASPVTVLNHGTLAIIQSSTERVHWPQIETRVYDTIPERLPWLRVSSYDESTLASLFNGLEQHLVTAIVVSPSAMASAGIRHQLSEKADLLRTSIQNGLGLSISAPFVTDEEIVELDFIPSSIPVAIARLPEGQLIKGDLEIFGDRGPTVDGEDSAIYRHRSTSTTSSSPGWTRAVVCSNPETEEVHDLAWQARLGSGFVFVSVLPLERLPDVAAFDALVGRMTWARGHVTIGEVNNRVHASPLSPASFEVATTSWSEVAQFGEHFGHLRVPVVDALPMEPPFESKEVLRRNEKAGSLEITLPELFERPSVVKFAGTPRYLVLLQRAEMEMIDALDNLATGPTFDLLAYNLCAREARKTVAGEESMPSMFSVAASNALTREALHARLRDGSVDGRILPTANLVACASLSAVEDSAMRKARKWLETRIPECRDTDELVQVLWVAYVAEIGWLRTITEKALDEAARTRSLSKSPIQFLLERLRESSWPPIAQHDLIGQPRLESAMGAYTFLLGADRHLWDFPATPQYIEIQHLPGAIESNFYALAAAVLSERFAPLSTGALPEELSSPPDRGERAVKSSRAVEDLRGKVEAEIERNKASGLLKENDSLLILTRRLLGVVTALWIAGLTAVALLTIYFFFPDASVGDWLTTFGACIVVIALGIGIAANSPRIARALPRWARWMIRFSGDVD